MASMNKCFNSMCIKQMHHWSIPTWAAFQVLWVVDARAAISFNISTQKVPKSVHEHLCCTRSYPFISSKYENLTTFLQLLLAVCHLFDTGFLPKKRETGKPTKLAISDPSTWTITTVLEFLRANSASNGVYHYPKGNTKEHREKFTLELMGLQFIILRTIISNI